MLRTQRHHQLLIRLLLAPLIQHAHVRLTAIERLAGLAQAAREPVVDEGEFQDAFEGFEDGHLAGAGAGCGIGFDAGVFGRGGG